MKMFAKQSNKLLISLEGTFCNKYSQSHKEVKQKNSNSSCLFRKCFKKKQVLPVQTVHITRKEDLKGNFP